MTEFRAVMGEVILERVHQHRDGAPRSKTSPSSRSWRRARTTHRLPSAFWMKASFHEKACPDSRNLTMISTRCRPGRSRAPPKRLRCSESLFPYAWPAAEIVAPRRNGMTLVLPHLPAGKWEKGRGGIRCHPGRAQKEFREGVGKGNRVRRRPRREAAQSDSRQTPAGSRRGPRTKTF